MVDEGRRRCARESGSGRVDERSCVAHRAVALLRSSWDASIPSFVKSWGLPDDLLIDNSVKLTSNDRFILVRGLMFPPSLHAPPAPCIPPLFLLLTGPLCLLPTSDSLHTSPPFSPLNFLYTFFSPLSTLPCPLPQLHPTQIPLSLRLPHHSQVDMSDPNHLPPEAQPNTVLAVIDRHSKWGEFWRSQSTVGVVRGGMKGGQGGVVEVEIEAVAACATLVVRRFIRSGSSPQPVTARLLLMALLSRSLDLRSPLTTEEDRQATLPPPHHQERELRLLAGGLVDDCFDH